MASSKFHPGECVTYTLEECVPCCCRGGCSIGVCQVGLVYGVVQDFYFLTDLLPSCSIQYRVRYWSLHYCWLVYSSPQLHQPLLHVLWGCAVTCIYICNCYEFLMDWSFYHYKMPLLSLAIRILFKSILSHSIATPDFLWLLFAWYIFPFFLLWTYLYIWV